MNTKTFKSLFFSFTLIFFSCVSGNNQREIAQELTGKIVEKETTGFYKFGNIDVNISQEELLKIFDHGDIILVSIDDTVFEMPICSNYTDTKVDGNLIMAPEGSKHTWLASNCNYFALKTDLARKADSGSQNNFEFKEEVAFPVKVKYVLKEKGGYLKEWELHQLSRTNRREDYPELSDEDFANFREVCCGRMKHNAIYRGTNPVNSRLNRNKIVDDKCRELGIKTFLNFSDTQQEAEVRKEYEGSYYSGQNIVYLNSTICFFSEEYKAALVKGLRYILDNPLPAMLHCQEGKDRTGFALAIIECLMGATLEEISDDFMKTFINFYKIEKGSDKYNIILEDNILEELRIVFNVKDITKVNLEKCAEEYLKSVGMTKKEILNLKAKLSK